MKVLKSFCEKAWLFDARQDEDFLTAGFACFVPGCDSEVEMEVNGQKRAMMIPAKAINSPLPLRMVNARLSLLPLNQDE
jgi:hypothetical protein